MVLDPPGVQVLCPPGQPQARQNRLRTGRKPRPGLGKLRPREVEALAQSHTAPERWRQVLLGQPNSKAISIGPGPGWRIENQSLPSVFSVFLCLACLLVQQISPELPKSCLVGWDFPTENTPRTLPVLKSCWTGQEGARRAPCLHMPPGRRG